jgi:hypothetical protein
MRNFSLTAEHRYEFKLLLFLVTMKKGAEIHHCSILTYIEATVNKIGHAFQLTNIKTKQRKLWLQKN